MSRKVETALSKHLSGEQPYALLEFPNYDNIGDSLIWLGALTKLRSVSGRYPSYVATLDEYSPRELEAACPKGPIFLQGGGNWGDLYPGFQLFRERLLADLPHRKVVQLPQSIHFDTEAPVQRAAKAVQSHPDFTMLVRDAASKSFAADRLGIASDLVPDCAFGLGTQKRSASRQPVLYFMRDDKEAVTDHSLMDGHPSTDWPRETVEELEAIRKEAKSQSVRHLEINRYRRRLRYFEAIATMRLRKGSEVLSRGEVVVCDRLHAHILCVLLNIPHVALDNSTGKVGEFYRAWTHQSEVANYAPDAATARELLKRLEPVAA